MNIETRQFLSRNISRQRDYHQKLQANRSCGCPTPTGLVDLANDAANSLYSLSVCEFCAVPEAPFARVQAAKFARYTYETDDFAQWAYAATIAALFTDLAVKCGDIGEVEETEEGEEASPIVVPEFEPVPA